MPIKKMILTRKIQLFIDSTDPTYRKECMEKLYSWQYMCFRCANYVMTHQMIQNRLKELIYIDDDIKMKLADRNKDPDGLLNTSRCNTTYRVLSAKFKGELPSDIFGTLNKTVYNHYQLHSDAYWKGERVLSNFKREIPMPFSASSVREFRRTENGAEFRFTLFHIPFRTYLGRDVYDKRELLQKILNGGVNMKESSLKLSKGRLYWLLTYQYERLVGPLNPDIIAEVSLSLEYPIVARIENRTYRIGNKEEFLYRRIAIQRALMRKQRSMPYNRSGKGKKKKLKAVENYRGLEKRYINYKLHVYSKKLIDLSLKHQAATILFVEQTDKEELARQDQFLFRNWSFYNLKTKIEYKARKYGITVISE